MESLKLCVPDTWSVSCEILIGFVDSLQSSLEEVSTSLPFCMHPQEQELQEILMEIEFLRAILMSPWKELEDHGKLDAISTHIDVLAQEAEFSVYSSAEELEEQANHEMQAKVMALLTKIKLTRLRIRETNKKNVMFAYCTVQDFLTSLSSQLNKSIMLELGFRQAFLRCSTKWRISHPRLEAIRSHTENMVRIAWWDIRHLLFRMLKVGKVMSNAKLQCILSDLLKRLTVNNPDIEEICTMVKVIEPSTLPCSICATSGLEFADHLCNILMDMHTCNPESFAVHKQALDYVIAFLATLREISTNLSVEDESRDGLLAHLEDLTDRLACLSYLQLVGKQNQEMSLDDLMLQIEEPGLRESLTIVIAIEIQSQTMTCCKLPTDALLIFAIKFLTQYMRVLSNSDGSLADSMKNHIEAVHRELIVLRCILTDPLKEYFEKVDLDDLFNTTGTGICRAGVFFFFSRCGELKENNDVIVVEIVEKIREVVSQAFLKFSAFLPSRLPKSEMGFFDTLVVNLSELAKAKAVSEAFTAVEMEVLHDNLEFCNSFHKDSALEHIEVDEMKQHLRTQIVNVGCKVENLIDTFEEVPNWFFKMRLSDVTKETELIRKEIMKTKLTADLGHLREKAQRPEDNHELVEPICGATGSKTQDEEMVGFKNEENELMNKLTTGSRLLEIVSIVGMAGVGKTTLAMEVYKFVAPSFHSHAWCYVSQNYQKKGLIRQIIHGIDGPSPEIAELIVKKI